MFTFMNRGVSGELLNSTQIEDIVFNGYYYEETIEDDVIVNTKIETGEIGLPTTEKLILPCGIYGKITKN